MEYSLSQNVSGELLKILLKQLNILYTSLRDETCND